MAIDRFRGSYAFLSNYHPSPMVVSGITYPTMEHAFQALKINITDEGAEESRQAIADCPTPQAAKLAGQKVKLRAGWDATKISIMEELLRFKFKNEKLAAKLLATGDELLIEGNTWGDKFWGVVDGEGRNELGKALMRVRSWLRKTSSPSQ